MTEEEIITLNCFVFGDPTKLYQVEIAKTKTAITLRKTIAQQLFLEQADANALRLYYLTTSIRKADIEKELEIFREPAEIPNVEELLAQSRIKISTLFPSPAEEDIHVIIFRPSTGEYKLSFNNFDPLQPCRR
jgi:hypothetical protein